MKKILSLILALVFVISIITTSAVVSSADYLGTKFQNKLSMLDQLFNYDESYMFQVALNELFENADYGAYEITVAKEDFENLLHKHFVIDDTMIENIKAFDAVTYDEAAETYTISGYGGFGGILPEREYLGYKQNGDTFDVYYRHISYGFLRDVLPSGVDEEEYATELDWPNYIVYEGVTYTSGPEGYYCIKSYDDYGKRYTVEFCDDKYVFTGNVKSYLFLLSEELPEGVDVNDYAEELGWPEVIEYNGIVFYYDEELGYCEFLWEEGVYKERECTVDLTDEVVRIISVSDYTEDDAPASFDDYSSSDVYTDVPATQWYKDSVDFIVSSGLMKGTSNTSFEPEATMTRAMVVTVLYRLEGEPAVSGGTTFEDLREDWYMNPVAWAQQNGIVLGNNDAEFDPYGEITREQLATILHRYSEKKGYYTFFLSGIIEEYPDAEKVDVWAVDALDWAITFGLITGSAEGNDIVLDPTGDATRAQVATILKRFCMMFTM